MCHIVCACVYCCILTWVTYTYVFIKFYEYIYLYRKHSINIYVYTVYTYNVCVVADTAWCSTLSTQCGCWPRSGLVIIDVMSWRLIVLVALECVRPSGCTHEAGTSQTRGMPSVPRLSCAEHRRASQSIAEHPATAGPTGLVLTRSRRIESLDDVLVAWFGRQLWPPVWVLGLQVTLGELSAISGS